MGKNSDFRELCLIRSVYGVKIPNFSSQNDGSTRASVLTDVDLSEVHCIIHGTG